MKKQCIIWALCLFSVSYLSAQKSLLEDDEPTTTTVQNTRIRDTYKSTRVINSHSVEVLDKRYIDVRIAHRFGDVSGGWNTILGLENASDISLGAEYGVSDRFMLGLYRTKGSSEQRALMNLFGKYRLLWQTDDDKMPLSISGLGQITYSSMAKSSTPGTLASFDNGMVDRFNYVAQLMFARKFSKAFSLQLNTTFLHRNLVDSKDQNNMLAIGLASRFQMSTEFAVILDAAMPISSYRTTDNGYYLPLGIGLEWTTGGGHVFQLNFTNAQGLTEMDFLANSKSDWFKGDFRLGFTISRHFFVAPKKAKH